MASNAEDELTPEQTEGFKVGEKKTIDEYQKLGMYLLIHRMILRREKDKSRTGQALHGLLASRAMTCAALHSIIKIP